MRRLGAALAALCVLPGLASCGSGGSEVSKDGLKDSYSVVGALAELPDVPSSTENPVSVTSGDLVAATKLGKLPTPDDEDSLVTWGTGLNRSPLAALLPDLLAPQYLASPLVAQTLGFDIGDVARFAQVDNRPRAIAVMRLRGPAAVKKGLTATGDGKPGDIDRGSPGDLPGPFPFVLGIGTRDGAVALAQRASLLADWRSGDHRLADGHDALVALAQALDGRDVYTARLVEGSLEPRAATPEELKAYAADMPDFDAVGVGEGVEDGDEVAYVAYHVDDADAAATAIGKVWRSGTSLVSRRPLAQLASVTSVKTTGAVVVVTLAPKDPAVALRMMQTGDTPFVAGS